MAYRTVFVAREQELAQLDGFLDLAMEGQGQVCFVTGEAGMGKTALVTEFARRAQEGHPDLVVAYGQCNAHTGLGDPYLPFREILQQLTGDVEEELARGTITEENASRLRYLLSLSGRALVEVGPDLVGLFLPGAGLATRLAAFALDEFEWGKKLQQLLGRSRQKEAQAPLDLEQDHIFEQYASVLQRLTLEVPMILILDDLHWTDAASAELLFHLGRRIRDSRLLIVGTYRPDEIALGRLSTSTGRIERHPMEKTITELKRYYGEIFVELGHEREQERQQFVEAFLDTEPNHLSQEFRRALLKHTNGHPLFTIELLRDMQERGDLVCDDQDRWVEGPALDWDALPARVEGVIEERIGRLSDELREELTVGSVEGESFTAEVVARVQETSARQLFRRFSRELERRHRLIRTQGVRHINDRRLYRFRFSHNLFQVYLYHELTEAEQMCLNEDVGTVLEALYGERAEEIAVQLARHFEKAGIHNKACHYLHRAGEQAAADYAHAEAVEFFSRALELLSEEMVKEREALLLARERAYDLLGQREAQEADLASLQALANAQDDDQLRAEAYLRLARLRGVTGKLDDAVEAAQAAIGLAQSIPDVSLEAAGYLEWGRTLQHQANYEQAERQMEKALTLTRSRLSQAPASQQSQEGVEWATLRLLEADSLRGLAHAIENRGRADEAEPFQQQARNLYQELGHRRGECKVLNSLGYLRQIRSDYEGARALFLEALALAREIGDRHAEGGVLSNLGTVQDDTGDFVGARKYHEEALAVRREIEDLRGQAISLGNLGVMAGRQDDHAAARHRFEEALALFREIGDQWGTGLTVRNLASVCLYLGDYESATAYTVEARTIFLEIDYPRGVAGAEAALGLLSSLQGNFAESAPHCQLALDILDEIGELEQQPQFLTHLGDALLGLNDLDSAAEAYTQAIELLRGSGAEHKLVEALAGLARIALAEGDPARALAHIEQLLPHLTTVDDPYYAYLTCYQVFRANKDARAKEFLTTAHRLLQENAALLSDETSRRSFLENVRVNREIVKEFARLHPFE